MWLLFLSLITCFIGAIRYRKSKYVFYFMMATMALMFAFVYNNADTRLYKIQYEAAGTDLKSLSIGGEPLWEILQAVFHHFHVPFEMFRLILFISCMCLIFITLNEITEDKNLVLLLYAVSPFLIDMAQIRNFAGMALVIYAVHFLFRGKITDYFKFILCIILAGFIHTVMWGYLVLLLVKAVNIKKMIFVIGGIIAAGIYTINVIPAIVMWMYEWAKGNMLLKYIMRGRISIRGTVAFLLYIIAVFALLLYGYHMLKKHKGMDGSLQKHMVKKGEIIINCNLILGISFLLVLYSFDFIRIIRNISILNYAYMWACSCNMENKLIYRFCIFMYAIGSCILFICWEYWDSVFLPPFQYNHFFEWFMFA